MAGNAETIVCVAESCCSSTCQPAREEGDVTDGLIQDGFRVGHTFLNEHDWRRSDLVRNDEVSARYNKIIAAMVPPIVDLKVVAVQIRKTTAPEFLSKDGILRKASPLQDALNAIGVERREPCVPFWKAGSNLMHLRGLIDRPADEKETCWHDDGLPRNKNHVPDKITGICYLIISLMLRNR